MALIKTCKRCREDKSLTEFYAHKAMGDGYLSFCKACTKERIREHRRQHDHVREYDRKRYMENHNGRRERLAKNARKWNELNPDGYKAHYTLSNAVRDGRLKREKCQECGSKKSHGHHPDYSKPLDVIWLCAKCHQRLHAKENT